MLRMRRRRRQPIALDIRFEDAHLIVIDKPAGLVVHPAPGNPDGTLVNALIAHCGAGLAGIGGVRRPGIVHRLDKDTSGLMVVAKTEVAHQALSRDFALRRIDRAYAAFVWGVPAPADRRDRRQYRPQPGKPQKDGGRRRRQGAAGADPLSRRAARSRPQAALVECRLATGRTHQIRVHFAHQGHPLIGDPVYGTRAGRAVARSGDVGRADRRPSRGRRLHARRLGFTHPASGGPARVRQPAAGRSSRTVYRFRATLNWTKPDYITRVCASARSRRDQSRVFQRLPLDSRHQPGATIVNGHPFGPFHFR